MKDVVIDYTNWHGERRERTVAPVGIRWGSTEHHKEEQWLLTAMDPVKGFREFAMRDVHSWRPETEDHITAALREPSQRRWPKGQDVARVGDMSADGYIRLCFDSDYDVCVEIWERDSLGTIADHVSRASIEFCAGAGGGGHSPRTRAALIELMCAMEEDNAAAPRKAWPPKKPETGSPSQGETK